MVIDAASGEWRAYAGSFRLDMAQAEPQRVLPRQPSGPGNGSSLGSAGPCQCSSHELGKELAMPDPRGSEAVGETVVGVDGGVGVHFEDERLGGGAEAEVHAGVIAAADEAEG